MANLETLELTINGSAEKASQGIDTLISRLSLLSSAITRPCSDLRDFNNALKETARLSKSVSIKNVGKTIGSSIAKANLARSEYNEATNNNRMAVNVGDPSAKAEAKWQQEYNDSVRKSLTSHAERIKQNQEYRKGIQEQIKLEKEASLQRGKQAVAALTETNNADLLHQKLAAMTNEYLQNAQAGKLSAKQMADQALQIRNLADKIERLKTDTGSSAKKVTQDIGGIRKAASNLLSTIGRIFKTMLIRQAIRTLLKGAKEGLDNYYQYSKKINGAFAASMDKVYKSWGQTKNQIGAALGSALNAVLPILNAIASAALVAFNAVTALFALLGGQTTYSQATDSVNDYTAAVKGAGGATKEWLASFDELNVMTQGGGGGGGSAGANIASMFKEIELPQWMLEWKPIIEGILAGTLGALILPKIFDWIKKIIDLFTGGGASNLLTFFKYLFKPDGGTNNPVLPSIPDDYNTFKFPEQPKYSPFPIQPTYTPFPEAPDYATAAAEMGALAAAATTAAPAVVTIVGALEKLKTGFSVFDILKDVFGMLISKILGGTTIDIKVDREKFDEFKKEYDEWAKDKVVGIALNTNDYLLFLRQQDLINAWVKEDASKKIGIAIDTNDYLLLIRQQGLINTWIKEDAKAKIIGIALDTRDYMLLINQMNLIDTWTKEKTNKSLGIVLNTNDYLYYIKQTTLIDTWMKEDSSKYIAIKITDDNHVLQSITDWVNTTDTKQIIVKVKTETDGNGNQNGNDVKPTSNNFFNDFFDTLSLNTNQIINKIVGNTVLPEEGFIAALWNKLCGGNKKTDLNISDYVNVRDDPKFKTLVSLMLTTTMNDVLSAGNIKELKNKFPTLEASDIYVISGFAKLTQEQQRQLTTSLLEAFGTERAIASIRKAIPNIDVNGLINLTNWQTFSDTQKLQFVDALGKAFGNKEALAAAKSAGIDIEKAVREGMKSQNDDIKKTAEKWGEIIKTGVESKQPVVKPKVSNPDVENTKNTITSGVSNIIAWVKSKAGWSNGYPNNLKTDIESQNPTVKAIVGLMNGVAAAVQSAVDTIHPTITASVTATGIDKIASAFKKALSAKVSLITDTGKQVGSATIAVKGLASGGLVNGGDLFIANENGVPEMIGRFGNQAGVANQGQIIAGISKGVYEANEQQNALLREQNALLRAIYEKDDGSGMPGVSAALGRQIKRSLDAYNGLVGG